jgi:hypothetical protein
VLHSVLTSLQKPWAAGHFWVSFWHAAIIFLHTGQPAMEQSAG